jgi:surface carbohydrate biosynthesis protein (TIGR04326 family)
VLQEFFTLRLFFKAAWWWLKQSLLSGYLLLFMDKKILTGKLAHPACLPILKYLWWQSFVGASGTRGILFYLTYKEMFHKIKKIKACLYFCEMQAWEKAFLMAKNQEQPTAKTLSFQHTVVMKNYFNYFYSPAEVMQTGDVLDFPLPDQLIANGKQMRALLAESFPNLWEAEAIRQLYISKLTQDSTVHAPPVPPVLLVVGSYDRVETKSLLTLVYKAFPQAIDFRIGFKGSPVNPVENLFNELGIDWRAANYTIEFTEIAKLLPTVSIALVANTTVAIEALAFKRPLIIPLLADTMLMNPVINTDAEFHLISTPEQLRMRVNDLMATDIAPATTHDNAFINSYWHLDLTIPKWTQLLTNALCD